MPKLPSLPDCPACGGDGVIISWTYRATYSGGSWSDCDPETHSVCGRCYGARVLAPKWAPPRRRPQRVAKKLRDRGGLRSHNQTLVLRSWWTSYSRRYHERLCLPWFLDHCAYSFWAAYGVGEEPELDTYDASYTPAPCWY